MSMLGIDLGTSGVRAAAFDVDGRLLAEHAVRTPLSRRGPLVETDATAVLSAVVEAIAAVTASPTMGDDPVDAISFSTQGEAVVPVDAAGDARAAAPVSMDRRGEKIAQRVERTLGPAVFQQRTGQPLHPMFSLMKIAAEPAWCVPETAGFWTLDTFVATKLGARPATDLSMAARTGAFDVDVRDWSPEVIAAAAEVGEVSIPMDRFAPVVPAGHIIGRVDAVAAAHTGLAIGTPIVSGLHDQAASFVGAGGAPTGPAVFALGSSDCLTVATTGRVGQLTDTGFATYPIDDSTWVALAGTAAGGWALEWLADLVREPVSDLFHDLGARPPALLVLPYLAGSGTLRNDPSARGVIAGLSLTTTRDELARAFLEAAGYELASIVDAFRERGVTLGSIRAVGAGAANRPALQVRASASGHRLEPVPGQSSARGAALLAGVGIGVFPGLADLPAPTVDLGADPSRRDTSWYQAQRRAYARLQPAAAPITPTPRPIRGPQEEREKSS